MSANTHKKEVSALIQSVLNEMETLVAELRQCKGDTHILKRAKGSILHDFYNACERIFELIAREVNGGIPQTQQWHKKLLYMMTVSVGGVRPAVISKELAAKLDEYLSFRHIFRNIYGFELEGEKLERLAREMGGIVLKFKKEIKVFLKRL
ncbi:MAG: hypothetical protein HZB36_04475 [Candidatus Omnitrophica bacterium]|nr:hypothetical protein [Candidatus Omnitrophota bacterium]